MWQKSPRVAGVFLLTSAWISKAALMDLNEVVITPIRQEGPVNSKASSSARESDMSNRNSRIISFHSDEYDGVSRLLSSQSLEDNGDVSQEANIGSKARKKSDFRSKRQRPPVMKKAETLEESSSNAHAIKKDNLPIDSLGPQSEVQKISTEISRIFSLDSPKFFSVEHDSDSLSTDIKKWDDVIGKEYDFYMKTVKDLAESAAHGQVLKNDVEISRVLRDLKHYCNDASWYTRQKICEARAQPLMIKREKKDAAHVKKNVAARVLREYDYALDVEQKLGLKKTRTSSDLSEMILPDPHLEKYELLKGLRECLYSIGYHSGRETVHGKNWLMDAEKLVLRVIQHMFEFGAIEPKHLNWFFSDGKVIELVGQHISNLFPHEFSAYGLNRECFAPDLEYLTVTSTLDHLNQCLPALKARVRNNLIRRALCKYYGLFQLPAGYKPFMPELNQVRSFVADEHFLKKLSNWKPNSNEDSKTIDTYVTQLIENFNRPEMKHGNGDVSDMQAEFMLNFQLLNYIAMNPGAAQSMKDLTHGEAEYKELLWKLEVFRVGKVSSLIAQNWNDASKTIAFQNKYGLSDEKLAKKIKELVDKYSELLKKIEETMTFSGVDSWTKNPVINSILQVFTHDLKKLAKALPQAPTEKLSSDAEAVGANTMSPKNPIKIF